MVHRVAGVERVMIKMKIVLFLGAGFSAPFGLPVMNSFIRSAQDSTRLSSDEKTFLDDLILEARRANSFLQTSPTNLEDILTLCGMRDRLAMHMDSLPRTPRVVRILQKMYTNPGEVDNFWTRLEVLETFLGNILSSSSHAVSIITTNYDLMAESAFHQINIPVSHAVKFAPYPVEDKVQVHGQLTRSGGFPLYKLHGSVNWYMVNDALCVEDRVVAVQSMARIEATLPRVCAANYKSNHDPMIIPPSFLKPNLPSPISGVWAGAANALHEADQIAFIGYSFPASDIDMKYFLASALVNNPRLRRIDVIDPNASALVARLKRETENGFGNHFRELLNPVSSDWTQTALELA